ncbi:MAG TPA: alpha/beta hydrolase-fold protein [Gaiellaceae bacterium]|nr:alpha/beta hydrolase-fold protein [Gaiellaceae bacterium]
MPWHELSIASEALRGNPLGDPHERPVFVWSPDEDARRYPTVYVLHAHMRSARWWFNVEPFERSYPEEIDALAPAAVVALVDGWTSVGGSQWIDSGGIGRYGTYLRDEVVPFVEERFPASGRRALQGKSSGGYGALVNAIEHPDTFNAVAAHAPDALFEVTIAHGFPAAARALRERPLDAWWNGFEGLRTREDALLVELWSSALAYAGGELPFEVETAELRPDVWARWLEHDPVRLVERHAEAARELRGVWLDAGEADSYFLDLGALALRRALAEAGVAGEALRFELFPGGHRGLGWRYPLSLAWLVERLAD